MFLVSLILDVIYFILGLTDARISAKVRRSKFHCVINFLRFVLLIALQLVYYLIFDTEKWWLSMRVLLHSTPFICMYLGTKLTVIGLTGGIACGKSTLSDRFKTFT